MSLTPKRGGKIDKERKIIYLIDGSAYIHRAYHAVRRLSTSKGFPTNAIFGFTRMILKFIEDQRPQYAGIFFDAPGRNFRHEMYPEYKANRPPMSEDLKEQMQPIRDITCAMNLPIVEMQGFEADDLIGTAAKKAQALGFFTVIVTGDKDFIQLITDSAIIWDPMKNKTIDTNVVKELYNIEPKLFVDMLGLAGDTSDNIPGVPGIGTKTALSLLQTFGTITELYERIDEITKKKQQENLVKYKEQAFLSKRLATIKTDAPISFKEKDFLLGSFDNDRLAELFNKFEFRKLLNSLPAQHDLTGKDYRTILKIKDLKDLISMLESAKIFAIDTETTSRDPVKANLVGLSFSIKENQAFYIPCCHRYQNAPRQLDLNAVLNLLKPLLEDSNIKKIGQNIKYDQIVLSHYDIDLKGASFDTMIGSYLINPSSRAHSLDKIAFDFLGRSTLKYEDVAEGKDKGFDTVEINKGSTYACEDAEVTLCAYNVLKPRLKEAGLNSLMEKVELPLIPVIVRMEKKGIRVDRDILKKLSGTFETRLEFLKNQIYDLAGETFNIRSSQQLGEILFEKLKLPVKKKTKKKTAYSTDVEVLTDLSKQHKLPELILEHRTLSKLKSTYSDALVELIDKKGRVHTSFNQTVTATGRLSSSNPNLQNIPVRTLEGREIRTAFIPDPGHVMVSADYSQIELRILAHYSQDPILIKAFMEDEDIHLRTATEVFQVFPEMIDKNMRRQAKIINFGIIYGMSPFGLSKAMGISRKMAQTYIDNYFKRYQGVKDFIDQTIKKAEKEKKTGTLLGRIRLLTEMDSSNRNVRKFAERLSINTPIQGTAADLIKLAMIKVDRFLQEKNMKSSMVLSVHDELLFEVPEEELNELKTSITDIMENIWELKARLKINIKVGKNWAEAA